MELRAKTATAVAILVASLTLTGCSGGGGHLFATGAEGIAKAAASTIRLGADDAVRAAAKAGSAAGESAARQAVIDATTLAVQNSRWQTFKASFTATVRVTRGSEVCQPILDLIFAKTPDDVLSALRGLSEEASSTTGAEELYADINNLVDLWQAYDPSKPGDTYVAVATRLFQDYYCEQ